MGIGRRARLAECGGVVIGLAVLAVLYFWPVLRPQAQRSFGGDFSAYTYPTRLYIAQEVGQGRLPHWSPHVGFGFPLLADIETAAFYPVSLLTSLLAGPFVSYRALELQLVLHFVLAGLGMFLLLRRVDSHPLAALFGAVTFMLCGFFWAHSSHLTVVQSACWGPWALLAGLRLAERPGARPAVATGVVLALSLLGGHPQIAYYVGLALIVTLAIVWGSARLPEGRRVRVGHLAAGTAGAFLLAVGLAAIQLAPTALLAVDSIRWGAAPDFLLSGSLPRENLITLVIPLAFFRTPSWVSVDEFHFYNGVVPLVLAAWVLVAARSRWVWLFGALALLGLVVALALPFTEWIGGAALFRIPARAVYLVDLGVAGLASLGIDALLRAPDKAKPGDRRLLLALWAVCLVATAGGVWLALRGVPAPIRESLAPDFTLQYLWLLGLLLASVTALAVVRRLRPVPLVTAAVVTGILLVDVLFTVPRTMAWTPVPPAGHWPPRRDLARLARELGPHRVLNEHLFRRSPMMEANVGLIYRLPSATLYSSLPLRRYERFRKHLLATPPAVPERYDLMGVRYVASNRDVGSTPGRYAGDAEAPAPSRIARRGDFLWEVYAALPRAYVPREYQVLRGDGRVLTALEGLDPARTAVLEVFPSGCGPTGSLRASPGTVQFLVDEPDRVRLLVRATGSGPLVLSDTYYPGWRATVDGTPTKIHRANYLFRAVCLPAGEHVVEFTFHPPGFVPGLIVTGLTGLVSLGILAWPVASRRRPGRPPTGA